jgi:hypothetical protein
MDPAYKIDVPSTSHSVFYSSLNSNSRYQSKERTTRDSYFNVDRSFIVNHNPMAKDYLIDFDLKIRLPNLKQNRTQTNSILKNRR